jgi:hypothetical protein
MGRTPKSVDITLRRLEEVLVPWFTVNLSLKPVVWDDAMPGVKSADGKKLTGLAHDYCEDRMAWAQAWLEKLETDRMYVATIQHRSSNTDVFCNRLINQLNQQMLVVQSLEKHSPRT